MLLLIECAMHQGIKRSNFIATKINLALLILVYFGASLVICDEDIPFCKESSKALKDDLKDWQEKCLNNTLEYSRDIDTPCCNAEKKYIQSRRRMQRKLCFYKDLYPRPYLLVRSGSEIEAVDFLTHDATRVTLGNGSLYGGGLAIDINDKKLYFGDGNGSLSKANLDGSGRKVILKNAKVLKMAIDWIGSRIFWTKYPAEKRIFVVNVDGKHERTLTRTIDSPYGIAVDPNARYLFWTEYLVGRVRRMNLAKNIILTVAISRYPLALSLDYTNKRVYWVNNYHGILSSSYDGETMTLVKSGSFNPLLLGIFEDSVYFQKRNVPYINEMNITNGIISPSIKVDKTNYGDLAIVPNTLQPMITEECFGIVCPRFGYCSKFHKSCQCEMGFKKNGSTCADIDECSSSPCGLQAENNCTNIPGSYKCAVCDTGYLLNELRKCMGPSPYLFINSWYDIQAVHMLSERKGVVTSELGGSSKSIAIDTIEMKLYFQKSNGIWMREINRVEVKLVIKNANVEKMAIDWIGRRIFWTEYSSKRISVANLDGKERRVLTNTIRSPRGIAIDSILGFLFWTEDGVIIRFNLADSIRVTLVTNVGDVHAIKLDCRKKRVYWLEYYSRIKSCDYGGKEKKTITEGRFNSNLLGVLGDSLYFLDINKYRINEMNVTNGNISRTILVDSGVSYSDLLVIDKSVQPSVVEERLNVSCGPFAYFHMSKNSCDCIVGFVKNETSCTVADYSDLKIRLVNTVNNKTGRVEIFHPSFGWGTVCDDGWDDSDSAVVCRQLGFTGANATRVQAYYGQGSGPILLDNVRCTGNESYIWDCHHNEWNDHDCGHYEDVGVDCY